MLPLSPSIRTFLSQNNFSRIYTEANIYVSLLVDQAALTAISTLALSSPEIRTAVTDVHQLLPIISVSIGHRLVGVRYVFYYYSLFLLARLESSY